MKYRSLVANTREATSAKRRLSELPLRGSALTVSFDVSRSEAPQPAIGGQSSFVRTLIAGRAAVELLALEQHCGKLQVEVAPFLMQAWHPPWSHLAAYRHFLF